MSDQAESVIVAERDRVLHIQLNRPTAGNALDWATLEGLHRAFTRLNEDERLWAGVLTATGEAIFCAGADLKALPQQVAEKLKQGIAPPDTIMHGLRVQKPLLCSLNGDAFGGGVELALACDLRIAADHVRLSLPEARVGLIPAGGATYRLPQLIGRGHALRMMLTGEPVCATEALAWGLVDQVVPKDELDGAISEWTEMILRSAPLAVQVIKELVDAAPSMPATAALQAEAAAIARIQRTADAAEGSRAFRERRAPTWCAQ
ncbi:enoyl-CoA hydratase/isomerase family protein [Mycobacterium sp. Lab-001]|uniref:enoyl-CoA hydratase/isomerase family protein n=1 Tax=Mycobacterium sp. Lab-001 TaxID=3410136 RepID=UPI003D177C5C